MYKLMKRIYLLLSLLLCSLLCMSQVSTSQNYISTRTYTSPDHSGCREQVVYFDGLGRPSQTVDCGITPDGKDLVSLQEYDDQGRKLRTWLPAKSAGNGNYMTLSSLQSGASSLAGGDARPYLQTTYEASPLNRPVAQHGAGETWAEHPVSYQYITRNPRSFPSSYYMTPSGNFLGVCTTDEDGNQAYEFKDGFGRTILAGRMDGSDPCFAYYEYDNHDDLVNVYPPFVTYYQMNEPEGPYATQSSYSYHYDFLHRCVYKKLPERDAIYYIYDHGDHQVLSQDGEQRVRGEWAFSLSDELNRPVLTGICHNSYYYDDFPLCETDTYNRQSNLTSLRRNGRTGASSYGLIDDLTLTLDGNWLTRVDDAATASAYNNGFEFKDAVKQDNEYTYDKNGNMTKDLNKNIIDIQYNCLNSPSKVTFKDGSTITYTYAVNGTKLRTVHTIGNTTTTTDYCGNVIYENGVQKLLLTDAGHVTLSDKKYHYYLQDHQGNNRVVVDQTGQKEEVNHYYPFGGTFASADNSIQPYKYNGKELDTKNGLNWYDYGARQYDVAIGRWNAVDPMAEKYYNWSPYSYCMSNPIKYIDPSGQTVVIWYKNDSGQTVSYSYSGGNVAHPNPFVQSVITAYQYNKANGVKVGNGGGASTVKIVENADIKVNVMETPLEVTYNPYAARGAGCIYWKSDWGLQNENGTVTSPATDFDHEAAHALEHKTNAQEYEVNRVRGNDSQYDSKEERRVITGPEQRTARANGETRPGQMTRRNHKGRTVVTKGVTSNVIDIQKTKEYEKRKKPVWTSEP